MFILFTLMFETAPGNFLLLMLSLDDPPFWVKVAFFVAGILVSGVEAYLLQRWWNKACDEECMCCRGSKKLNKALKVAILFYFVFRTVGSILYSILMIYHYYHQNDSLWLVILIAMGLILAICLTFVVIIGKKDAVRSLSVGEETRTRRQLLAERMALKPKKQEIQVRSRYRRGGREERQERLLRS